EARRRDHAGWRRGGGGGVPRGGPGPLAPRAFVRRSGRRPSIRVAGGPGRVGGSARLGDAGRPGLRLVPSDVRNPVDGGWARTALSTSPHPRAPWGTAAG